MFDPAHLVFLDETAANTKMMRVGGRCLRGERLIGQVPHGHWKTITFVGALRCKGMTAPNVIDGAMKGKTFLDYVEHHLAPTLRRNDTVVMDNLPAHKAAGVREAIEARGAVLRYLPQYSPDLNPIEMPFSKLKASSAYRWRSGQFLACAAGSERSRVISLLARPRIILGTQAMPEIERICSSSLVSTLRAAVRGAVGNFENLRRRSQRGAMAPFLHLWAFARHVPGTKSRSILKPISSALARCGRAP